MKKIKKAALLLLALLVLCFGLVSCDNDSDDPPGTDGDGTPPGNIDNDVIYSPYVDTSLVLGEGVDERDVNAVKLAYYKNVGKELSVCTDPSTPAEHEILIGKTGRALSQRAYRYLARAKSEDSHIGYAIFSDGHSIAVAFDEAVLGEDVAFNEAMDCFVSNLLKNSTLKLEYGAVCFDGFDAVERQSERDAEYIQKLWELKISQLTAKLGGNEPAATGIVLALQQIRDSYNDDHKIPIWLANLYDPESGGFYYSNSARNAEGYLPDLESTAQALGIVEAILVGYEGTLEDYFGEEISEKFVSFAKGLQDENGYFYHPQWTREATDKNQARKNIDVLAALNILKLFGASPIYDTPNGVRGEGIVAPAARLTTPLRSSGICAAAHVISTADDDIYIPAHLQSKEAFDSYLSTIKMVSDTTTACNTLIEEIPLYLEVDKMLAEKGESYSLVDILTKSISGYQNKSTGLWAKGSDISYAEIAELQSVVKVYNAIGKPIPYYSSIFSTIIRAMDFNEEIDNINDISNVWASLASVVGNITTYSDPRDTESVKYALSALYSTISTAIYSTYNELVPFVKDDYSFSSLPGGSDATSHGMTVALFRMDEGDVNATILATKNIYLSMFKVLDVGYVPIFGSADQMMFRKTLLDMGVIIKDEVKKTEPKDFEDYNIGSFGDVTIKAPGSNTYSKVIEGTEETGRVLHLHNDADSGIPEFHLPIMSEVVSASCLSYELDMCVLPETGNGKFAFLQIYQDTYIISVNRDGDTIKLYEESSRTEAYSHTQDLGVRAAVGEWFNLRVEYYVGTASTVRIKIFFNGECIAVTDNYFGNFKNAEPSQKYSSLAVYALRNRTTDILIDNVITEKTYASYTPETSSSLHRNVDTIDKPQRVHSFESFTDGQTPEDFVPSGEAGSVTIVTDAENNKLLSVTNKAGELLLPLDQRGVGANSAVIEFDLTVSGDSEAGAKYQVSFNEYGFLERSFGAMEIAVTEEGGRKYVTLAEIASGQAKEPYSAARMSTNTKYRLRFHLFFEEGAMVVSLDNEIVGINTNILAESKRFYMGETTLTAASPDIKSEFLIDNLVSERIKSDFNEATAPKIDREIYDFEGSSSAELSGVSPSNGTLSFDGANGEEAYVQIPINLRVNVPTLALAGLDVRRSEGATGDIVIFFTDKAGNKLAAFNLVPNGASTEIYEYTGNGRYKAPIHTIANASFNISFEYDLATNSFNILADGEYVAASSLLYTAGSGALELEALRISSFGPAGFTIDNLYAEQIAGIFSPHEVSMPNTDATKETIDYETSSFASMPSNIEFTKGSPNTYFRIGEGVIGENVSKVLEFYAGYGDSSSTVTFNRTHTLPGANAAFFESDIMLEVTGEKSAQFNMYFRTSNENKSVYYFGISISPDSTLQAVGNNGDDFRETLAVKAGEWFKIRLEYADTPYDYDYDGTADMIYRVYVNGEFIAEGHTPIYAITPDNPTLPPASSINKINTYIGSKREAKIYYDNTILGQFNMLYEEPYPADTDTLTYEPGVITDKTQFTFDKNTSSGKITEMTVEGEVSKVLMLHSANTSTDKLAITPTLTLEGANAISFETDILIDPSSDTATFYLEPTNKFGKQPFRLTVKAAKDGDVTISAADIPETVIGKSGEWIHIKVEYMNPGVDYTGDRVNDILYKIYINKNSDPIAIGYKPYLPGAYYIPLALSKYVFTFTSESVATVFFDNIRFWQVALIPDAAPEGSKREDDALEGACGNDDTAWTVNQFIGAVPPPSPKPDPDPEPPVHTHSYGAWTVVEADKPTESSTGTARRACECTDEQTLTLPALTDASYTITDNTAEVGAAGTGTYTVSIEGNTVSFTAPTPSLAEPTPDPEPNPNPNPEPGDTTGNDDSSLGGSGGNDNYAWSQPN